MSEREYSAGLQESKKSTVMLDQFLKPIRHILDDEAYTGIAINRPGEVWGRTRGTWIRHECPVLTYGYCLQLGNLIASYNNDKISQDKPILSCALPTLERVNIAMPPACQEGTITFTIRKFGDGEKDLYELESEGSFSDFQEANNELEDFEYELLSLKEEKKIAAFLELAVKKKRTIVIAGATGSGKTYLTKSLIRCIPTDERLITIEDVWELFLVHHPNRVHLFFARDSAKNFKVMAKDAIAACLRMEPSRILLAEMRGDEAWEFVKVAGSGHPGSISTIHANGALEAFEQFIALIKDSKTGAHLDIEFIRRRLFGAIDIVLYYSDRKLRQIYYDPKLKRANLV
ncbi:P-type DNA transfer ATPase VirB11 [Janthinobacterium sp. FW305-128]|uniref:P-type DNA transfer ATPase VirB11 n=1 Tax=Janthinobacterium sp. FW305-128 TaxID=2775055 RepID=UPI001E41DD4D|nr:P-type DNA transfer ATPase VirB11 [Janthinobacterium sp. FW305-128]MCC7684720.1 P-type DNA transfer ATPase VirB11 [Janthinobacterium sp. FW305-128]